MSGKYKPGAILSNATHKFVAISTPKKRKHDIQAPSLPNINPKSLSFDISLPATPLN